MAKAPPAHPRSDKPCGYSPRELRSYLQITPRVLFQKRLGQYLIQRMEINLRVLHIFMAPFCQRPVMLGERVDNALPTSSISMFARLIWGNLPRA